MNILEEIDCYPGIPFFGIAVEMKITGIEGTDIILNITAPAGFENHLDIAAYAVKFFDGELITAEKYLIRLRADSKMVSYILMFAYKEGFERLKQQKTKAKISFTKETAEFILKLLGMTLDQEGYISKDKKRIKDCMVGDDVHVSELGGICKNGIFKDDLLSII